MFWKIAAIAMSFYSLGILTGVWVDKDYLYKVTIGKIKQRGKGNNQDTNLDVNLPIQTKREGLFKRIKNRRDLKKSNK